MSRNILQTTILLSAGLALAVFGIEIATPRGVSEATLYVLVVLLSLRSGKRQIVFGILIFCTLLTVLGYFVSGDNLELWISIANRSFAITAFWIVGLVGLKQLRTEESLQGSEQKFFILFEKAAFAASLAILPDGMLVDVNEAFEKSFEYTKQEAIGRTSLELGIHPRAEDRLRMLAELKEQGFVRNQEVALHTKSGKVRSFSVNIDLIDIGSQQYILSTTQDITERKRAEEDLRTLNRELEQRVEERMVSLQASLSFTNALYEVAQSVISLENPIDILKSIVDTVAWTLSADRAVIITFDHEARHITQFVRAGPGAQNVNQSVSYEELMEGLSGWCLRELHTAYSPKGAPDPRESLKVQQRRKETNCGGIVVLPLTYLGEALGTMSVINTPEQPDFTEQEVKWMEAIASQASTAMGRAQIYEQLKKANILMEEQSERLRQQLIDLKQVEMALAYERDLLQALMDNVPDTIYFKDTLSRFTRINRAQARVLNIATLEQALGKTDLDFFQDSELAQEFFEEEQLLFKTGQPVLNRVEFNPMRDGAPRWFAATKVPIKDEDGDITGLVGISRDITSSKLSEEALRQSEERLRLVSWATKDAVWDWDLQTGQIQWGAGLQKIFHYPADVTQTDITWWNEHIHPEDREKVKRSMDQALEGGMEFWSKEYRFQHVNGTFAAIMDRGYILRDDMGRPYRMIGAMMDITDRKQAEETIRQQNDMLSSLHHITLNLLKYRELDQLLHALVEFSATFLNAAYAEIMLLEGEILVVKAATQNQHQLIGRRVERKDALLSWQAFDTHEPAVLSDYTSWPQRQTHYDMFSFHAVADFPIVHDDKCLGVLALGRDKPEYEFSPDQIQFGRFFANLTALVINNAELREALREQAIRDLLTGLFNRRYMEETLRREVSRITRQGGTLGIIMIDLDRFKRFNDTYGHVAGDALLRLLGQFLQGQIRSEDIACRYGGEELILIMPNTSLEVAQQRAEHLRQTVKQLKVPEVDPAHRAITLSIGVAVYPEHGHTMENVLRAADAALYRAKQEGRDRVVIAEKS